MYAYHKIRLRRGVVHVIQSAEQLDVQKNFLLNGFDSSTENTAFFKVLHQKKQVAPFAVKKINFSSPRAKELLIPGVFSRAAIRFVISADESCRPWRCGSTR